MMPSKKLSLEENSEINTISRAHVEGEIISACDVM